jgi:hypothetical protein
MSSGRPGGDGHDGGVYRTGRRRPRVLRGG